MAYYRGVDRYFLLTEEAVWNTHNSSGDVIYPVGIGDDGVAMAQDPGQNILETNVGHGIPFYINTGISSYTGTINCLVPNGVQGLRIVKWGSTITSGSIPSYTLDIKGGESATGERWTGLTVDSMTLTSGSDSGAQRLTAAISVIGGGFDNGTLDPVIPAEDNALYPAASGYLHSQCDLTLGAGVDATVTDLTITFTNILDVGNGTGTDPSYIQFCGRQVTLDCTIEYDADTFRSAFTAQPPTDIILKAVYTDATPDPDETLTLDLKTAAKVTAFTPVNSLGARATSNISFLATSPSQPEGVDFSVT